MSSLSFLCETPGVGNAAEHGRALSGADEGADMLTVERRLDALGTTPVDHLEVVHQAGRVEQVEQHAVEGQ